jgi:hypothetical protein
MIVEYTIDDEMPICACYDDCIDKILAARDAGRSVRVREITLAEFEAYPFTDCRD